MTPNLLRTAVKIANYIFIILIAVMWVSTLNQVFYFYSQYGVSYNMTTTIGVESVTQTRTVYENIFTSVFMFALLVMFLFNTAYSHPLKTGEKL